MELKQNINFDQLDYNDQDDFVSIQFSSGEMLNVNSGDLINKDFLKQSFSDRIKYIDPAIKLFEEEFHNPVNLTPLEAAEFEFMKVRISNLEKEKGMLLNIINKIDNQSFLNKPGIVFAADATAELKHTWKKLIGNNHIVELQNSVNARVDNSAGIYEEFILNFARYSKNEAEHKLGSTTEADYNMNHNKVLMALIATIDKLVADDLLF
ncbi:MAG: hypothetical protein KDC85_03065 [Saprospiraceae bacterium]|nr:hypothetical protein [Saprospiraceae bacterium]MCB9324714.1 hypothetical protein [Lewinellaceae bacterium]